MFNYSLTDPIFLYVFSSLKKLKLSMYSLQARGGSLFLSGWRLWLPGKSNFHPHPGHATGSEDPEEKLADEAFQGCCDSIKSIFLCINPRSGIEIYKFLGPKKVKGLVSFHFTTLPSCGNTHSIDCWWHWLSSTWCSSAPRSPSTFSPSLNTTIGSLPSSTAGQSSSSFWKISHP